MAKSTVHRNPEAFYTSMKDWLKNWKIEGFRLSSKLEDTGRLRLTLTSTAKNSSLAVEGGIHIDSLVPKPDGNFMQIKKVLDHMHRLMFLEHATYRDEIVNNIK